MKVYLTGPVKGVTYDQAMDWRLRFSNYLRLRNIKSYSPLRFREKEASRKVLGRVEGDNIGAMVHRDINDVRHCDLVCANFFGSEVVSLGSVFELGYAYALQKPVVLCMDAGSMYDHCFLTETSGFVVHTEDEALEMIVSILNHE